MIFMKQLIIKYAASIGIEKCGFTHYQDKSAIVCLFPYFIGDYKGNLSVYAQPLDYHKIIKDKLSLLSDYICSLGEDTTCSIYADIGPEIDRHLAYSAGLGFYGKNSMLINPDFGSYFFIGYILCNIDLEKDTPLNQKCDECNLCIKSCPGGALGECFDINKCASHISQKKGELTLNEEQILKKSGLIFGCDICQKVCPHNNIIPKPMKEFTQSLIYTLNMEDIKGLSNKEFLKKYKDRAFSWRGRKVIERNLDILNSPKCK